MQLEQQRNKFSISDNNLTGIFLFISLNSVNSVALMTQQKFDFDSLTPTDLSAVFQCHLLTLLAMFNTVSPVRKEKGKLLQSN